MNIPELISANHQRKFFFHFNENPKSYPENLQAEGLLLFQNSLNSNYKLPSTGKESNYYGEEISPFLQTGLGIHYPQPDVKTLVDMAGSSFDVWKNIGLDERFRILFSALENVSKRFFEIGYATMHTTGQSFLMSFQASGPHACDRALEVMATAYEQLTYFPQQVEWSKNMGKFELKIHKSYKPVPRGVGLVIGCSTFPTWNTVPGVFADLITGNSVIVKPHPKAVYPIAIFIEELQKVFLENKLPAEIVQLAIDSSEDPITKQLAENEIIQLIDYTGGNHFGNYVESLGKICFTEKSGINSVILDSCENLDSVAQNIAFSVSLYSGQMCTAPQNIYISDHGVKTPEKVFSYQEAKEKLLASVRGLIENPKAAAPTLGAIQNDQTLTRINQKLKTNSASAVQFDVKVENAEFSDARIQVPSVITVNANESAKYLEESFGPLIYIVKTDNREQSLEIVKESAKTYGAITCLAYTNDADFMKLVEEKMNAVFTPVSFNFTGAAFVNQHAAFSDLHVSGGNPSGNATFTNAEFINKRYIWIGNRYML